MTTNIDEKKEAAAEIKDTAVDEAASAAGTAREQAGQVASTAIDEAQQLAAETKDHARALIDEGRQQAVEQSKIQRDRLVGTLQTVGDDLDQMATNAQGGLAADLARQVADRTRQLSSAIESREPVELLGDVKAFAQRKPGTFLLGALAAGVVAGRLLRGAKETPPPATSGPVVPPQPTGAPTSAPTAAPTAGPTSAPTAAPTGVSTGVLTDAPLGGDRL